MFFRGWVLRKVLREGWVGLVGLVFFGGWVLRVGLYEVFGGWVPRKVSLERVNLWGSI